MVRQDPRRLELAQQLEVLPVHRQPGRFVDVRDRVLQRVAAQEEPLLRPPRDDRVVAVDLGVQELEAHVADLERSALAERRRRQHEGVDRRRPVERAAFDRGPELRQHLGRALTRDDFAINERLGSRDVIGVPVAQDNGEVPNAVILEHRADPPRVLDRDVRVVHER